MLEDDSLDPDIPLFESVPLPEKLTKGAKGLRAITRQYTKASSDELDAMKSDMLEGEFLNVIAKRYSRSLSNVQYWAKKWKIPSTPERLKKTVAGHLRSAQKMAITEAKTAHNLDPGTAQGVLWTILLDKGQPASARVSAFEKLHAVAGWGAAAETGLPEPSTPDELVTRVLDYLTSLNPRILDRVLRALPGTGATLAALRGPLTAPSVAESNSPALCSSETAPQLDSEQHQPLQAPELELPLDPLENHIPQGT